MSCLIERSLQCEPVARLIEDACALAMAGARQQGIALHLSLDRPAGCVLANRVQPVALRFPAP